MTAEHERVHVLDRDLELHRHERAHPRRVEHAGHADDALARKLGQTEERLRHRVERVGHRERRSAFGQCCTRFGAMLFMISKLSRTRSSRLMPGLRGLPEVMTTMSEPAAALQSCAADHARVRSDDRTRLVDVERDARGLLLGDVDDDDVGQLLLRDRASHRHADVAGATYHCHFAIHAFLVSLSRRRPLSLSLAIVSYPQFLLKTLLKTPSVTRSRRMILNVLAVCTIVVRTLRGSSSHAHAVTAVVSRQARVVARSHATRTPVRRPLCCSESSP